MKILHVEDDGAFADLAATYIERENEGFHVETAATASEGMEMLDDEGFDCVVSDYDMPGDNGIEFLETVRENHPKLPFILFTGKGSEEVASKAISSGVTDYLQKESGTEQFVVLANRVQNAVEKHRAEREVAEVRARQEAITRSATDAIVTIDTDSTVRFANDAVEDIFGYSVDEVVGEQLTKLMPPRFRDEHLDSLSQYVETGERSLDWRAIELPALHHDGSEFPVSVSFSEFHADGERRFLGVVRDTSRQTQIEEHLHELERFNRELVENAPIGLVRLDEELRVTYENPVAQEIFGVPENEETSSAVGEDPRDLPPIQRTGQTEKFERLAEGESVEFELWYESLYGNEAYLSGEGVPLFDDGDFDGAILILDDITDRKERERELARVRSLLDSAKEIADVGGWEIDPETREVVWTEHLYDILDVDFDSEPTLEKGFDVYHAEDRSKVEDAVQKALERGEPFDVEARFHGTDDVRWARVKGVPEVDDGDVETLRGTFQDVTQRKRHERDLEHANSLLSTLFDTLPVGVTVLDDTGAIVSANERAEELLGLRESELRGRSYDDPNWSLVDEDEEPIPEEELPFTRVMETDEPVFDCEHEIETADGSSRWLSVNAAPLHDDSGDIQQVVCVVTDRTEQRQQTHDLERKNERLEEFASIVSHDLRNPLNVAEGRLELARENPEAEHLDQLERALERMDTMIDDLSTLAREPDDETQKETVEVEAVAEDSWSNVATGDASLDTDVSREIQAYPRRLQHLFENLFRNAVEHGGRDVSVEVGKLDTGFYVEDTGPGIPENRREEVFDDGYTSKPDGTGYGLVIVQQVAETHGWKIKATEGERGGARFEVTGATSTR